MVCALLNEMCSFYCRESWYVCSPKLKDHACVFKLGAELLEPRISSSNLSKLMTFWDWEATLEQDSRRRRHRRLPMRAPRGKWQSSWWLRAAAVARKDDGRALPGWRWRDSNHRHRTSVIGSLSYCNYNVMPTTCSRVSLFAYWCKWMDHLRFNCSCFALQMLSKLSFLKARHMLF